MRSAVAAKASVLGRVRGTVPARPRTRDSNLTAVEWLTLGLANLVVTVGIVGDITRHITDSESLNEPFLAGWHLVLYGGVASVGLWLGVLALRRGPEFLWNVPAVVIGFGVLSFAGAADSVWHAVLGTEQELEALVSPPHMLVMVGLILLLSAPVSIMWAAHGTLDLGRSVLVVVGAVSSLIVVLMFTGYASVFAGGVGFEERQTFTLPASITTTQETPGSGDAAAGGVSSLPVALDEPVELWVDDQDAGEPTGPSTPPWAQQDLTVQVIGSSHDDYDVAMGMATVAWSSVAFAGAFALILGRFRLATGVVAIVMAVVGVSFSALSDATSTAVSFVAFGLAIDVCSRLTSQWSRRAATIATVTTATCVLWLAAMMTLAAAGDLEWTTPLWTGTVSTGGLIAAAVAWATTTPIVPRQLVEASG